MPAHLPAAMLPTMDLSETVSLQETLTKFALVMASLHNNRHNILSLCDGILNGLPQVTE